MAALFTVDHVTQAFPLPGGGEYVALRDIFLDIARVLGIPAASAERLIRVKAGDEVAAGFVVARGGGLLPRNVKVPRAGRVVARLP